MSDQRFTSLYPHSIDFVSSLLCRLQDLIPMQLWMVTRTQGENWTVIKCEDKGYGVRNGNIFQWGDSFCSRMVRGEGPCIAPDAQAIGTYQEAGINQQVRIGSYIGVPLRDADHSLIGTLCAIDPNIKPKDIENQLPLVQDFAGAISGLMRLAEIDQLRASEAHLQELDKRRDMMGFFDLPALSEFSAAEEERLDELAITAGVLSLELSDPEPALDGREISEKLEMDAPILLRQWADSRNAFVARISAYQYLILLRERSQEQADSEATSLSITMSGMGLRSNVSWGLRDSRRSFTDVIRECFGREKQAMGISTLQSAPH